MAGARADRLSFAKIPEVLPLPSLLSVQHESFGWFLERGLREIFEEVSPIEDFTGTLALELTDHRFEEPTLSIEEAKERDANYSRPLFVIARFVNRSTGEIKEQQVFLGDFPMMTPNGTFIINGTERVVVSQLVRSPGVYFDQAVDKASDRDVYSAKVIPGRGAWLEFDIDKKDTVGVRVDRKRRQFVTTFLRALDFAQTDEEMLELFDGAEVIRTTLERDLTTDRDEALLDLYRKLRPGELTTIESARGLVTTLFYNPKRYDLTRVGRYKLNQKFGRPAIEDAALEGYRQENLGLLTREDILETIRYLICLHRRDAGYRTDDIDHFGNRRVRTVGELIQNQIRVGLTRLERVVRERMTTQDPEAITPQSLINIRPVVASIKEFFGTSQLSQFMDQPNPLAGLTHRRRLSALGPGGLSRERAGFEVRDVHSSHYGRMCPIETPEGPNIGLIGSLASYGQVNRFGFIETPYRRVVKGRVTGEVAYLTATEEERHVIAQANAVLKPDGSFEDERILVRRGGGEVDYVTPAEIDYMDVSPKQVVSVATALIPFLEHDDANRALMGSNMQRQAVPLLRAEAPLVGTGVEARAARDSGDTVVAAEAGEVVEVAGGRIVVQGASGRRVYPLKKFVRSNQGTCINQKPLVDEGMRVRAGDVLADGPSTEGGELALGRNLLVAFMPWRGHNYEDAIVISERLVKEDLLTSIHIEEYEIEARDTKLGAEEITRDIPNVAEEALRDLDEQGIVRIGAEVGPGDYLVGKVTPKGETELTPEERLLRAIFGEKAREVRDMSLKVPHGESGKAIDVRAFRREEGNELPPGMNELVRVHVAQQRKIAEGDKLAGRHGNKGVIAKILPEEDMPFLADGTPVDIILSPLGVPSRMNLGQVLETHLGWAAAQGWRPFEAREAAPAARQGAAPWTRVASPVFDGAKEGEIAALLANALPNPDGQRLVDERGKAVLYDGRNGEPFDRAVTVGWIYVLKLLHLVDDKIHARSTGPYSMITQQPLGGKAQFGGQRFGEMEVWALEAYGAAYALQELLTIKSDDVRGRVKVYEAIVKGENIPEAGIPESFKVLIKEMQSLCLNVEMLSAGEEVELRELDEDMYRTAESLGIDISRPERGD
ncbi:MAG: DNA-directed RNA polymerase subunit beta [Actinobacteria bacterium]|nr:DNA-directed RNA polymerase subunit beta [Actinomycetota bacterium]